MQPRSSFRGRGTGSCLLAALLLSACGSGSADHKSPSAPIQRLNVTARDFALKIQGSPTLRPGAVSITARNTGREAHGLVLVKLNDGISTQMLIKAITDKPEKLGEMYSYVGGTTSLPPGGGAWQATTKFDAGNYAMLDVGSTAKGRLNITRHGEVQGFKVSGKPVQAAVAKPTAEVALFDYGITIPRVLPPSGTMLVENTGNDVHQLVFVRVTSVREARAVVEGLKTGQEEKTQSTPLEALAPTSAATATTIHYRLPRGAYIAYCVQATRRSGNKSHASVGMISPFSIN
jgi:hypothetical protein